LGARERFLFHLTCASDTSRPAWSVVLSCHRHFSLFFLFFFNDTATTEIYTLSLHDALPIWSRRVTAPRGGAGSGSADAYWSNRRSEEHTSELQSRENLVCRLLLEKKKKKHKG